MSIGGSDTPARSAKSDSSDSIVVTGIGVVSPIGCGETAFWDALRSGRSGASPVTGLDTAELPRRIACQVREPVCGGDATGRASQLAVAASRQALEDARIPVDRLSGGGLAVIAGTTMGETEFIEDRLSAGESEWLSGSHLQEIAGGKPGSIARQVLRDVGVRGFALDLYGACAAGNMAITAACRNLIDGRCDVALAGGADGFSRLAFQGFMRLRVMAAEACRPFDEHRDGLLVGEGSAMLVLERASSAESRGATIRARIAGCGVTGEDYHPTRPSPDGDGLRRAMLAALRQAGLRPADIGYVCAHGTGTPQNDAIEVKVMQRCFPEGVPFSSIKALTGHTMGATAAMEAVCCVLSLENELLIPTWNLRRAIPAAPLDPVADGPRPTAVRFAMNNSAGFGGYNSSIILAKA